MTPIAEIELYAVHVVQVQIFCYQLSAASLLDTKLKIDECN